MVIILDKSVQFYKIIMHRKKGAPVPQVQLPDGFKFVGFKAGDELDWAEIETSAGEFNRTIEALVYFQKRFLAYLDELERRTIFIENAKGEKAATLTSWWAYTGKRRDPWIHWVSVKSRFQGLGLGKSIVFEGMHRTIEMEGDRDVYLSTQTWSYKAIGIYMKAGFEITRESGLGGYENDYDKAMPIIDRLLINPAYS